MIKTDISNYTSEFVKIVNSDDMPWFRGVAGPKFKTPMFFHALVGRDNPEPNSSLYYPAIEAFNKFCELNNIRYEKILRMCLNLTVPMDYCDQLEAHVDFEFPHGVFILYLNDCSGDTLIYNETYGMFGEGEFYLWPDEYSDRLSIKHRVSPKAGTAICFDGAHYHANEWCKGREARAVLVVCFK